MIITREQAKDICFDDSEEFRVIEAGEWEVDGKYQNKTIIFEYNGKNYSLHIYRSGSPFSDYYYCWEDQEKFDCDEVERVEVIKYEWKIKTN
jgi:hypothetical protein